MPDLYLVLSRWWKFILGLTLLSVLIAWIVCQMVPKEYLSEATALPTNSLTTDRNRLFSENIEALYSEFGLPDELDRFEGTGKLDTIFIATARELGLEKHYKIKASGESWYKAAVRLRKKSKISKSAYGELKVRVWDEDRNMAALICNTLLKHIQSIHHRLQNQNNQLTLQSLQAAYDTESKRLLADSSNNSTRLRVMENELALESLRDQKKLILKYQSAIAANPPALLVVEYGQAPLWHDRPKTLMIVTLTFVGALLFCLMLAIYMERKPS